MTTTQIMITDPMIVASIAGSFGILGAVIGGSISALWTRSTEYQKWLRQERNIKFAAFLPQMKDFQFKALDIVLSTEGEELQRGIQLSLLKRDFEIDENVVRLFLGKADRESFSVTLKELRDAYDSHISQVRRIDVCKHANEAVQKLFEQALYAK